MADTLQPTPMVEAELFDAKAIKVEEPELEEGEVVLSPPAVVAAADDDSRSEANDLHSKSNGPSTELSQLTHIGQLEIAHNEYDALAEDHHKLVRQHDELRQHLGQLDVAQYEYVTLEDRYRRLVQQHKEIHKLCLDYIRIVKGNSSPEEQSASIQQLLVEAGREGLRVKALETAALRPLVQEAGGLQALVSQMKSVHSLIAKVGGLRGLEELVSDMHTLRVSVDEVGGLQGLQDLVIEGKLLRSKQQDHLDLNSRVDGPDGLAVKAAKYDKLMQAFNEVEATIREVSIVAPIAPVAPTMGPVLNPARASLIASTPLQYDLNRDLYEPPPLREPLRKTGSNDVPLGHPQPSGRSVSQAPERNMLKREASNQLQNNMAKRPRVDLTHASNVIKSSLTPWDANRHWQTQSSRLQLFESAPAMSPPTEPRALVKLEPFGSTRPQHLRSKNQPNNPVSTSNMHPGEMKQSRPGVLFGGYPIALWIGATLPYVPIQSCHIKMGDRIPKSLGNFLVSELTKHINDANVNLWNEMFTNKDTCVLRYVLDGHRPSGQPQDRRACLMCASHDRPCALLQEVDGVRTIVFMPLRWSGSDTKWYEKGYWVMNAD